MIRAEKCALVSKAWGRAAASLQRIADWALNAPFEVARCHPATLCHPFSLRSGKEYLLRVLWGNKGKVGGKGGRTWADAPTTANPQDFTYSVRRLSANVQKEARC